MSTTPTGTPDPSGIDLDELELRYAGIPDNASIGQWPCVSPVTILALIRLSRAKEEVERAYREVVESARDVAVLGVLPHDYQEEISNDAADARQQRLVDALAALPKETHHHE